MFRACNFFFSGSQGYHSMHTHSQKHIVIIELDKRIICFWVRVWAWLVGWSTLSITIGTNFLRLTTTTTMMTTIKRATNLPIIFSGKKCWFSIDYFFSMCFVEWMEK